MLSWEWFLQTVQPESAIAPWSCPSFSNANMAGLWLTSSVSHIINMLCQGPSCFLGKHEHPEGLSGGTKAESDSLSEHPVWSSGCSLYHVGNSGHFLIYCWTKFVNIISVLFYLIREQLNFVEQHCLQLQTLTGFGATLLLWWRQATDGQNRALTKHINNCIMAHTMKVSHPEQS